MDVLFIRSWNWKFFSYLKMCFEQWGMKSCVLLLVAPLARPVVFEREDKVVGGLVLTPFSLNRIRESQSKSFVNDLSSEGFWNLSYFVIDKDHRGKGLGSAFLHMCLHLFPEPVWLICARRLQSFYERGGLRLAHKDSAQNTCILVHNVNL